MARPRLLLLLLVLGLAACSTQPIPLYSGPQRSLADVAVITPYDGASLYRLDGERVLVKAQDYHVLPGKHVIGVAYTPGHVSNPDVIAITFVVEAGQRYLICPFPGPALTWDPTVILAGPTLERVKPAFRGR